MRLWPSPKENDKIEDEHTNVARRLYQQEEEMRKMAERLRILEIEAGIYKPTPLRRVN